MKLSSIPMRTRRVIAALIVFVLAVAVVGIGWAVAAAVNPGADRAAGTAADATALSRPVPSESTAPSPVFDKTAHSIDDPASIWVVANKSRPLNPLDFEPADLVYPDVVNVNDQPMRPDTAAALVAMFDAGNAEAGLRFQVQSAYRSYDDQVSVYNRGVSENGKEYTDGDTARPGHSEHQTGLAVDISARPASCSLQACFADTAQGEWLAANAWRFGFLLRYPADKVDVTGFTFEPWHYRYIGTDLAAEMHRTGVITLEEFFGVPGGTVYP